MEGSSIKQDIIQGEGKYHCFCDDIVFEIVLRLPLKYAIQCSCLNKNLYRFISDPSFKHKHALLSKKHNQSLFFFFYFSLSRLLKLSDGIPNTYTTFDIDYSLHNFHNDRILVKSSWSRDLHEWLWVECSCNGLLLLHIDVGFQENYYHVFNPLTGGLARIRIKESMCWNSGPPGFVVDIDTTNTSSTDHDTFQLVMISRHVFDKDVIKFDVHGPSDPYNYPRSTSIRCPGFDWISNSHQPVYTTKGSLHWLEKDARKILAFDVRKRQAMVVNGPLDPNPNRQVEYSWFGEVDGSLSFLYTTSQQKAIIILIHDSKNDEWRIKHMIPPPTNDISMYGVAMFFDGGRLYFHQKTSAAEDQSGLYTFDTRMKQWKKETEANVRSDAMLIFFSFSSTLVKVSDEYVQNSSCREQEAIKKSLLELRDLLMIPHTVFNQH